MSLYDKLAEAIPKKSRLICQNCGREYPMASAHYLKRGWPKCCGYTVRLITPAEPERAKEPT